MNDKIPTPAALSPRKETPLPMRGAGTIMWRNDNHLIVQGSTPPSPLSTTPQLSGRSARSSATTPTKTKYQGSAGYCHTTVAHVTVKNESAGVSSHANSIRLLSCVLLGCVSSYANVINFCEYRKNEATGRADTCKYI